MKLQIVFTTVLCAMMFASSVSAATVSRKDLEAIQTQVKQKNVEHKRLQAQAIQISVEMSDVSRKMVKRAKQIQNLEDKISELEKELERLQKELKIAEDNFITEDKNLIQTLYALQNLALNPTESLFVQPLTPVEIIRCAMLLRETTSFLEEEASQILKKLDNIAAKKETIEKQYKEISRSKEKLKKEHQYMKALILKKAEIRKSIESKSSATKQKIMELGKQAKDVRELLIKLEKEKRERERLMRARMEKARQERELLERYRAEREKMAIEDRHQKEMSQKLAEAEQREREQREQNLSDDFMSSQADLIKDIGKSFEKAKGKLSKPARGSIVVSYGQETAKGVTSKGITIKTRSNAQVVSPFDGSVVFVGPFRSYGKIIIIEHGEEYMSLLAGLENIDCEVGQMLLAGEPIGQMPQGRDVNLYMELRKDNRPLDPAAWIAK